MNHKMVYQVNFLHCKIWTKN